jgi:hypothetical protein
MRDQIVEKPMARKPIRDPRIDQPPECRLMPFVGDESRARSEGFAAARPKVYLPCLYWEEALQEDPPTAQSLEERYMSKFRTAVLVKKYTA